MAHHVTEKRRAEAPGRPEYAEVLRIYRLAKKQEWQVRDLPWNELPPIPEALLEGGFRRAVLDFLVDERAISEELRSRMLG